MDSGFLPNENPDKELNRRRFYVLPMVSPRTASLVSLGALPAMAYYAATADLVVAVSVLNVLIIATSLYLIFSPISTDHDHTTHA